MIQTFNGNTWVAFIDISGFKQMMKLKQAEEALTKFYDTVFFEVFNINKSSSDKKSNTSKPLIKSIIVSDAAILFVDNQQLDENKIRDLHIILNLIKSVNTALIKLTKSHQPTIMTTCAMSYGPFKYDTQSTTSIA